MDKGTKYGEKQNNVQYLPEQIGDIQKTLEFKQGTMTPAYKDYMSKVQGTYDQSLPGMYKTAQEGAGYAKQLGQVGGEVGESAARTGVTGLESFFAPGYGAEQFAAAMAPIQTQYQQNLANQGATFGGAGQLGSARQALAGQQLAGQNQAAQMQAAAGVMRDLNQQRLQAGSALGQLGQGYLGQGMDAMGRAMGFAERPMDWTSAYGKQLGLVPPQMYTPQYPNQQSTSQTQTPGAKDIIGGLIGFL